MRIPKYLYLIGTLVLVVMAVAGCTRQAPKGSASELLQIANKAAVKAQKTEGNKLQIEAFEDAVSKYRDVVNKKNDSPEAAEAQLAMAKLMVGLPIDAKPGKTLTPVYKNKVDTHAWLVVPVTTTWQAQNFYNSRDTFRGIVQQFGKIPFEELEDNYGRDDAVRIRQAVEQAKVYENQVGRLIDQQNSGKILYKIIDGLVRLTGKISWFSYWFAIILITVIVKIIITPLTKAQFKSMREMQRLQPLVKQIQEKYKGDQRVIGEKLMELYKEHGVNPLAGCLPILIQMPILFTLYYTIRYYEYQFTNGTFLWIGWESLVHKWSLNIFSGRPVWLTAANLAEPDLILLLLYTVSMIISQRLSVVDPSQAEQQKIMAIIMPVMFFFLIGYLPSAFVLYWFVFNLLQTWQQYHVIHGAPPIEPPTLVEPTPEAPTETQTQQVRRRRRRRR